MWLEGILWRQERDVRMAKLAAWHAAKLGRARRLPPLHRFLGLPRGRQQQTLEEQLAVVRQLQALFGGELTATARES